MDKISVVSVQNRRNYMEDTYVVKRLPNGNLFMAVFDGHGGASIANMCKDSFPDIMYQSMMNSKYDTSVAIHNAFASADCLAHTVNKPNEGCTACVCLVSPDRIWFANAGDSMAMVLLNNNPTIMSYEHKVENEKNRIISEGGLVTYWDGVARVNGTLNVSRSIGDFYLKQHVISVPHVRSARTLDVKYICIASDGIWDVISKEDVHDTISKARELSSTKYTALACSNLTKLAISRGSTDNITIIIVPLDEIKLDK